MQRYWITGISRGIGEALARALAGPDREIIGLSRTANPALAAELNRAGVSYRHVSIDLTDGALLRSRAGEIFPPTASGGQLCLINNAGMIGPGRVGELSDTVDQTVGLNSTALFVLCDLFAAAYQRADARKYIFNITSGAAGSPMAGLSLYCATKASVDIFTRAMALEQESAEHPFQVAAISPGMVETGMQETIRAMDPSVMPASDRFRSARAQGAVQDVDEVAAKLVRNLFAPRPNGSVIHVRELE